MATAIEIRERAVAGTLAQNAEVLKLGAQSIIEKLPGEWAMEPKYDGWRIIAVIGHGTVDLFSRSGKAYNGKLPGVEAELLANFPAGTVLDGEAVALTPLENGKILNEWGTAQSVLTTLGGHAAADKVTYMVFDLIAHAGIDARSLPWASRRKLLERIFYPPQSEGGQAMLGKKAFNALSLTPTFPATDDQHETLIEAGFEGSMLKRLNAPYASDKRGAGWIKIKPQTTIEAVVMGYKEGENGFKGLVGAIIFGQHDGNGKLVERGRCSGMDMRTRIEISQNREAWLGRVIEVGHMGVMKEGFRHPQFKRVRKDKAPEQVVMHDA